MSRAPHLLHRPDRYPRSSTYDPAWLLDLDMGPHPLWQLEDLLSGHTFRQGQRVLDLGCGRGATSVFLAREYGVDVVAFDLWVPESELRGTLEAAGVADRVAAVEGSARDLPFDDAGFDAIVSVDAFEYVGTDVHFLPGLLRVLKRGGWLGSVRRPCATTPTRSLLRRPSRSWSAGRRRPGTPLAGGRATGG